MIDEAAAADARSGVNFNARKASRELRDYPSEGEPPASVKAMRQPMQEDRVKARVAEEDFQNAARRRIAPEDGVDLFTDRREQTASSPK